MSYTNYIKITKKDGIIIDFDFYNQSCEVDYLEHGEEKLSAVVMEGFDVRDILDLEKDNIPLSFHLDIINSDNSKSKKKFEFEDNIFFYGFNRNGQNLNYIFNFEEVNQENILYDEPAIIMLGFLEKLIRSKDDVYIVSELEIDNMGARISIAISKPLGVDLGEYFELSLDRVDELFKETKEIINHATSSIKSKSFKINVPHEIRTPIKQYLQFFEDYVLKAKGQKLNVVVKNTTDGLLVDLFPIEEDQNENFMKWLSEFVSHLYENIDNLIIDFELKASERSADILIASLKNEIAHFKNSFEIAKLENKFLTDERDYLRSLISTAVAKDIIIRNQSIMGGNQQFANEINNNE